MKSSRHPILTHQGIAVVFTGASIGALTGAVHFRWFTENQVVLIAGCTYTVLQVVLKVRYRRQPGKGARSHKRAVRGILEALVRLLVYLRCLNMVTMPISKIGWSPALLDSKVGILHKSGGDFIRGRSAIDLFRVQQCWTLNDSTE